MPNNTISDNLIRLNTAKNDIATAITNKGGTVSSGDGFEDFATDIASITNQYTSSDEGKVVDNGELVAQTDYGTVTENGTYNTTTNNSITVNVSGSIAISALTTTMPMQANDMYIFNGNDYSYIIGTFKIDMNNQNRITFKFDTNFTPTHTTKERMWVKYGSSMVVTNYDCAIGSNSVIITTSGSSTYFSRGSEYGLAIFLS